MASESLWLSTVIDEALDRGREVTVSSAENYGFHLEIDGHPVTKTSRGEGLPWEALEYPLVDRHRGQTVVDESLDVALSIVLTGDSPLCHKCFGTRSWFTISKSDRDVHVSRCRRCGFTRVHGVDDDRQ